MPSIIVVGAQWGDEGKGKMTDYLAAGANAVVRYQGGNNAGHTVVVGHDRYKLHLVPSGILYPEVECILGNGVVVDLPDLVREIDELAQQRLDTSRLLISEGAHCILPYHKLLDSLEEAARGPSNIGTTRRGIGPAYRDKIGRSGIRLCDLRHPEVLRARLAVNRAEKGPLLQGQVINWDRIAEDQLSAFSRLEARVGDAASRIEELMDEGKRILFEGAQGTFLDIDHGTYPFVTSSSPTAAGACTGTGIGPMRIDAVLGVTKAYCTRVGTGPFPTEVHGGDGDRLVERGAEYGTTTGRRRRPGWLDAVMLRHAVRVNSLSALAVTKLDVLDSFETIRIATSYTVEGQTRACFPSDLWTLERAKPIYEEHPGWMTDTSRVTRYEELPAEARRFLERIETLTAVPVQMVSVGASREATLVRKDPWECLGGKS